MTSTGRSPQIDLNADLGEASDPHAQRIEDALIGLVSSVNIACGGHAGDDASMLRVLDLAAARGCSVGAHPSYPDRAGFGRVRVPMSPGDLASAIGEQVGRLAELARARGVPVAHVKPHGALYHDCSRSEPTARAVLDAATLIIGRPALVGPAGSQALAWWSQWGSVVVAEGFADRRYEPDGALRPRDRAGAILDAPAEAARQSVDIALRGQVLASDGSWVRVPAQTLCVHADTPGAVALAQRIRRELEAAGIRIGPVLPP